MLKWVKGSQNGNKENEILTKNKDFKEIICCDEKEAPPTEEKKTEKETEKTEKAGKDEHLSHWKVSLMNALILKKFWKL